LSAGTAKRAIAASGYARRSRDLRAFFVPARNRRIAGGSDVQIVPAADALKVSCLVSGIEGDWSGSAGIVIRSGGARELRATMTGTPEKTFAYVSCLRLRP
jgi:hypothetical protein